MHQLVLEQHLPINKLYQALHFKVLNNQVQLAQYLDNQLAPLINQVQVDHLYLELLIQILLKRLQLIKPQHLVFSFKVVLLKLVQLQILRHLELQLLNNNQVVYSVVNLKLIQM